MHYTIKRVKSKAIRIRVHGDGRVVVTTPRRVSERVIEKFVDEKRAWIADAIAKAAAKPKRLLQSATPADYKKHKAAAMTLAAKRLAHFNAQYKLTYRRLTIRNGKTRWGSCSRTGSISFSYAIALLPPVLADYIVVHELCHVKEFNHSPRFWKLVSEAIPDYKERKKLLKTL